MIDSFVSLGAEKDVSLKHLHAKELSRGPGGWDIIYSGQCTNVGILSVKTLKGAAETCGFPSVHLKLYSELGWGTSSISRVLN